MVNYLCEYVKTTPGKGYTYGRKVIKAKSKKDADSKMMKIAIEDNVYVLNLGKYEEK